MIPYLLAVFIAGVILIPLTILEKIFFLLPEMPAQLVDGIQWVGSQTGFLLGMLGDAGEITASSIAWQMRAGVACAPLGIILGIMHKIRARKTSIHLCRD